MKKEDRANYIKAFIVLILVIIGCSVTGCGSYGNDDIIDKSRKVEIADEFEMVYGQDTLFYVYWHIPTNMMYIKTSGGDFTPMLITYEEYIEKSRAFHEANDKIIEDDNESGKDSGLK